MIQLYQDKLKENIGEESYSRILSEVEKEIGLAMQMPLVDEYRREKYYRPRFLLKELLIDCELFEQKGLKFSPLDVVNIFFKCRMLLISQSEEEYNQRVGGGSYVDESRFVVPWTERSNSLDVLVDRYFIHLESHLKERTLLTEINSFDSMPNENPQEFFNELFKKIGLPFAAFFEGSHLDDLHKKLEPHLKSYTSDQAKRFFCAPSMGFTVFGSETYCYWYASTWLRASLNILRIAGYLYPHQIDFGREVNVMAPTSSVFLGKHSTGCFCWDEDQKESWLRTPDGCLFLSFGYRGFAKIWLDSRTYGGIEKFVIDHKKIYEILKNPWNSRNINDVAPTLDILSSATQVQDVGAKILLVYCSLEHMFVPKDISTDNKKYIVGAINALRPDLLPWFMSLYKLRCSYAHKGYVLKDKMTTSIIMESMRNAMSLLIAKLSNQNF